MFWPGLAVALVEPGRPVSVGGGLDVARCTAQVIELNPFLPTTDGCLFSWERERAVLTGEAGGFELRLVEKPRLGAASVIANDWKALIESESVEAWRAGGAVMR
jgi:hypothetical protein